ncbi:GGDEF-domain containing protein [Agrobacterium vitis]|nr:GGDEF-domain containing protein [Agrobacterium vitis]
MEFSMKNTLPDPNTVTRSGVSDRRRTAEMAKLYREETEQDRIHKARFGLWAASIVYILFSITDFLLVPDVAVTEMKIRLLIGVLAIVSLETQIWLKVRAAWIDLTCSIALIIGYGVWLYVASMTELSENLRYYMVFGTIFMMSANLFFGLDFLLSIATSAVVLLLFFWSLTTNFAEETSYVIAFGTFFVSCFIFTSYVNLRLNRERHNVFLNALEARKQHREAIERGKALLRLSNTDYLTGVENRRAIDQRLRDNWAEWQSSGTGFAAILVDVDFFKKYNDYYGHQAGDHCLVLVANALKTALLPFNASIGRYGGEEFIVLAPAASRDDVGLLAEMIRNTVEKMSLVHDQRKDGINVVTVSVGAAFTRPHFGPRLEKIITEADRALYSAKANGRNCVRLFDPNDPQSSDDSEHIAALLRVAVANNLVSLVYQPILNLTTGKIDAAEALMRLKLLDGTPVTPSVFIPIAERTGSILDLGLWTLRQACTEILVPGHAPVVSINVSPIQLKTRGFAAAVAEILIDTGVDGQHVAFEITEGINMDRQSDILRCIKDLENMGIRIWLDDFGTGFAGLSWLRLFNFDTVKIDRSFLHDSDTPKGRSMLRDIIALVRNRGHRILVEGIETEEQLELMRQFDIDHVQGFYIGRPATLDVFKSKPLNHFSQTEAESTDASLIPHFIS